MDPAFKASDLSNEFAAFSKEMSDSDFLQSFATQIEELKDNPAYRGTYNEWKYVLNNPSSSPTERLESMLAVARSNVDRQQKLLDNPAATIDDATQAKPRSIFNSDKPKNFGDVMNQMMRKNALEDKFGPNIEVTGTIPPKDSYLDKLKMPDGFAATEMDANKLRMSRAAKSLGKTAIKMLPVVGTAASIAAMADRAQAGDYVGAGLEGASELADYIPGAGTAVSGLIQAHLADRDMSDEERKEANQKMARQALRSMNVHSPRY